MRGKPLCAGYCVHIARITPAYAGKTLCGGFCDAPVKDHPRVCGENLSLQTNLRKAAGSPPRMRGKHTPAEETETDIGITPAYAGKTCRVE